MSKRELAKRLLELTGEEADKRREVQQLRERRNELQLKCHAAQTKLENLRRERGELLRAFGIADDCTDDPAHDLLHTLLSIAAGDGA